MTLVNASVAASVLVEVHQALRLGSVQPQTFHANGEVALVAWAAARGPALQPMAMLDG